MALACPLFPPPSVASQVAAMYGSGEDIIMALLEARNGPSPNQELRPPWMSAQNVVLSSLALLHRCGGGGQLATLGRHFFGASPLHFAATFGFLGEARLPSNGGL